MGRAYTALQRFERARRCFERALAKEDHAITYANLAFVLLARHVMLEVIEDFPPAHAATS